jgi:hypothetical protein
METKNTLTAAQTKALEYLTEHGYVFSGTTVQRGAVVRVAASTLRALERKGLVTIAHHCDGGLVATSPNALFER